MVVVVVEHTQIQEVLVLQVKDLLDKPGLLVKVEVEEVLQLEEQAVQVVVMELQ